MTFDISDAEEKEKQQNITSNMVTYTSIKWNYYITSNVGSGMYMLKRRNAEIVERSGVDATENIWWLESNEEISILTNSTFIRSCTGLAKFC